MDAESIAVMVVFGTLILTTGGVILLRPIAVRLAELLKVLAEVRRGSSATDANLAHLREVFETVDERLSLLEERQDFAEELLRGLEKPTPLEGEGDPSKPVSS